MSKEGRDIPFCSIFLALGALACHTMVLFGNFDTAGLIRGLGDSTNGWSSVMVDLSETLHNQLDAQAFNLQQNLTDLAKLVSALQVTIDSTLSSIGDGSISKSQILAATANHEVNRNGTDVDNAHRKNLTDEVAFLATNMQIVKRSGQLKAAHLYQSVWEMAKEASSQTAHTRNLEGDVVSNLQADVVLQKIDNVRDKVTQKAEGKADKTVDAVKEQLQTLLGAFEPVAAMVKDWQTQFNTPTQMDIEDFSTILDRVQKMIDLIMSVLSGSSDSSGLIEETFNLFDTSKTGTVSEDDIHSVATMYGITALQDQMGSDILKKYDWNGDGQLDRKEFTSFATDDQIPGAMAYVLRSYAKKLAEVSGRISAARMRDEVAASLVQYLELVCAKNMTKVSWVSDALGNGSLPIEFTVDVLKELAVAVDDPNKLTVVDPGLLIVGEMVKLHPGTVLEASKLLSNATYWALAGWEPRDQAVVVQRVSDWASNASKDLAGTSLLEDNGSAFMWNGAAARRATEKQSASFWAERRATTISKLQATCSPEVSHLRVSLLGSRTAARRLSIAAAAAEDPSVLRVLSSGTVAKPETLQFAQWLSNNASHTANMFNQLCFDQSSQSSSSMDSFANQVHGLMKYMSIFLNLMKKYTSDSKMDDMREKVQAFIDNADAEVNSAIASSADLVLMQEHTKQDSDAWMEIVGLLEELQDMLPQAIDALKYARQPVNQVSAFMDSIFSILGASAPPLLTEISKMYKMVWICYFVLLTVITLIILFYGFWSSGWCGGPKATHYAEEGESPKGCRDRMRQCCQACCSCWTGFEDTQMCFWSIALIAQILILAMYMVSILVCIIAGVKLFLGSSCGELYVLGDNTVCTEGVTSLRTWLPMFWTDKAMAIDDVCSQHSLMTCRILMDSVKTAAGLTVTGSIGAATFSFLMLVESARDHELARYARMLDAADK